MGLGYLILSIKSEQDKYLTGNPQFTFFKSVFKRHTNFAIDYQYINFTGDAANVFGKKVYIDVSKNGDLLHRMYVVFDISGANELKNIVPTAYSYIEYIDLFIGGQRIDRHYGTWLQIWHELYESNDVALGKLTSSQPLTGNTNKLYVPLRFWFNNNPGLALPLIALQYNDIKIEIKFNNQNTIQRYSRYNDGTDTIVQDTTMAITNVQILCEFVHLDKEERRLFASNVHEYLITQVQSSLSNPVNLYKNESIDTYQNIVHKTDLRFNHPVKELVWYFQDHNGFISKKDDYLKNYYAEGILHTNFWRNFTVGKDHIVAANISLNGKDMTDELPPQFYRGVQNYQYHSGVGLESIRDTNVEANAPESQYKSLSDGNAIYSYSFGLNPEDFQPSGSINFSNIEQAQLKYRLFRPFDVDSLVISAASTAAITNLTPTTNVVDGVTLSNGDIILVKDQPTAAPSEQHNNGVYVFNGANNVLTRHPDFDSDVDMKNNTPRLFKVVSGTVNSSKLFLLDFKQNGTLGTAGNNVVISEYTSTLFDLLSKTLNVYAVNYNVLRVMSGMASLAFSN